MHSLSISISFDYFILGLFTVFYSNYFNIEISQFLTRSILATENGWLLASSRILVNGDSNIRASGGVSR